MKTISKAQISDLEEILEIYKRARQFMRENGNPNQWKDCHPPKQSILENISVQNLYVIKNDETIDGVFLFDKGPDPTYEYIEGKWLNDRPYCVIHRIASSGRVKGILKDCVDYCLKYSDNIKVDTHSDNIVMQHSLEKLGFIHCGTIYVPDYGPMRAYQYDRHLDKA
ncbi:MAG: N-acetyltransferase [Ruminococcaceae bacterium]|nr:N-acetyltransferase [Oscillospiraceae bacterium]